MSDKTPVSELYQQSKKETSLKQSIKRDISDYARQTDPAYQHKTTSSFSAFLSVKPWWALTCSILVAVVSLNMIGLFKANMGLDNDVTVVSSNTGVAVEIIEPNLATRLAKEIIIDRQAYAQLKQQMLADKSSAQYQYETTSEQYQYTQLVRLEEHDKRIEMYVCGQKQNRLIDTESVTQDDGGLFKGQLVEVVFNSQGKIVQIREVKQEQC